MITMKRFMMIITISLASLLLATTSSFANSSESSQVTSAWKSLQLHFFDGPASAICNTMSATIQKDFITYENTPHWTCKQLADSQVAEYSGKEKQNACEADFAKYVRDGKVDLNKAISVKIKSTTTAIVTVNGGEVGSQFDPGTSAWKLIDNHWIVESLVGKHSLIPIPAVQC
jgi:hypothetical protein